MARTTTQDRNVAVASTAQDNIERIFHVHEDGDAQREAAYAEECAAFRGDASTFFDSRHNREMRRMMQQNRAPFLS